MKTLRAHGFNQRPRFEQVVGYSRTAGHLVRHKPLLPGRFRTVQQGPQPSAPGAHASAGNSRGRLPHSRTTTDEDVRLARRLQGYGGTRFVEDNLAGPRGQQRSGAALHHGPSAQHCRRRSGGSGPHRRRRSGACRLAAAQAFRSQLPQVRAPERRPGQAQPPPQIIGRPSDVERLLDEAGQRAQEVERGAAQAVEETAAVAAEAGKVAVAAEGVGGAFGYLAGLAEGAAALAPTAGKVAGTLAGAAGVGAAATAGLAVGIAGGAAYGLARTGWVLENTLFRPQQGSEDAAVQDVRSANNMNDATQPQHFTLRSGSSTSGSPASSRTSSQSGFSVQHAAPSHGSAPVSAKLAGELQFRPASAQL